MQSACEDRDECHDEGGQHHECLPDAQCVNVDSLVVPEADRPRHPLDGRTLGYECRCTGGTFPHPVLEGYTPSGCMAPGTLPGPVTTSHRGTVDPSAVAEGRNELPEGGMTAEDHEAAMRAAGVAEHEIHDRGREEL